MNSQDGNQQSLLSRLAQLEAENKTLQEEISHLRSFQQLASKRFEERLAFEEGYKESAARFQTIFEQSILGNKIIADDLRIIKVNQALQTMLGYNAEDLVGTRVLEYVHPNHVKPWRELQQRLWKEKISSFGIETCLIRKDSSSFPCRVTSILFTEGEHTLGYTILEDISERKLVEVKLKKLYESQEILIHTVAHDLKNPIHIIKTLSSFLKKDMDAFQEIDEQKKFRSLTHLEMIETSCEKAYSIIKDLLLIGEIELGKQPLEKENIEMKSFIEPLLRPFQLAAKEKGIGIHIDFSSEPVYAQINRDKFTRVIENLLSNAIKFTSNGGQVTVRSKKESQRVLLQVSDTGIGIPDSIQSNVFQKFTKAKRRGTEGEATTGLGLYIVKQIVELHKGNIWLESKENIGTSFYIELV
ncbi:PAS domain S-box protein [Rhodocytophaga rosea]|uniref:histidine kinase n=1 Tax=Rhodocytophaga rosea TaxID=2704465 RepID=A0A6C0GBI9_9BACT|nr:PAS domain-containing sensor histidine kinase [Rhodocytophaga rosea]QHT65306.1 PAS domain S-box protein [Rhodocytophaga rosea]